MKLNIDITLFFLIPVTKLTLILLVQVKRLIAVVRIEHWNYF